MPHINRFQIIFDNAKRLLVIIGNNYSKDLLELILVELLSHKDTNIY